MTTDEKNRRLAELLGWTNVTTQEFVYGKPTTFGTPPYGFSMDVPNFCHDLNAVHEVVMGLDDEPSIDFVCHLLDVLGGEENLPGLEGLVTYTRATAEMRVDALILTLEGK